MNFFCIAFVVLSYLCQISFNPYRNAWPVKKWLVGKQSLCNIWQESVSTTSIFWDPRHKIKMLSRKNPSFLRCNQHWYFGLPANGPYNIMYCLTHSRKDWLTPLFIIISGQLSVKLQSSALTFSSDSKVYTWELSDENQCNWLKMNRKLSEMIMNSGMSQPFWECVNDFYYLESMYLNHIRTPKYWQTVMVQLLLFYSAWIFNETSRPLSGLLFAVENDI